jgi:hypothetical protein
MEALSDYLGIPQLKLQKQKSLGLSEMPSKLCICTERCSNHTGVAMCADSLSGTSHPPRHLIPDIPAATLGPTPSILSEAFCWFVPLTRHISEHRLKLGQTASFHVLPFGQQYPVYPG